MIGRSRSFLLAVLVLAACGGGKTPPAGGGPAGGGGGGGEPGDTHATPPPDDDDPAAAAAPDAGVVAEPEPPKPAATLVFKNESKQELTFAIDKGWGTMVYAYSGKPPKAKAALLFPSDCTSPCDANAEELCPVCKEAEDPKQRQKDEKATTKREIVAAGASFTMEWDGQIYAYEKVPKEARGRNKKCECWKKVAPEPESYTIKACGLRAAKKVGAPSKMQCVETAVTLPLTGTGTEIVLAFP